MIGALNTANLASVSSLDSEVLDWYKAIDKDGGWASEGILRALDKFLITLKINGVRDKIKRCNLFCGGNLRASLHPIIKGNVGGPVLGRAKDINYGFRTRDYSYSRGLSAEDLSYSTLLSSASKYLLTGAFLSDLGVDNWGGHISFMSYHEPMSLSTVGDFMIPLAGGDYSSKNDLSAYMEFNSENRLLAASPSSFNPGSEKGYVDLQESDVAGFWLANRSSNTSQKVYLNGAQIGEEATLNQENHPTGGYKFRIFSTYSGGQETQTSIGKILFYSIGEKLTESNITVLNEALTKFNLTLGRN